METKHCINLLLNILADGEIFTPRSQETIGAEKNHGTKLYLLANLEIFTSRLQETDRVNKTHGTKILKVYFRVKQIFQGALLGLWQPACQSLLS